MLPLPILNVGYPKVGSNSLKDYLDCLGLNANHGQNGKFMHENLANYTNYVDKDYQADAYTQLDRNEGPGYYPQISLLDELHELDPDATLVFLFRPMADWIPSLTHWNQMRHRMSKFVMPGLVLTPEQLNRNQWLQNNPNGEKNKPETKARKFALMLSDVQLAKWWCGHALHIREYVKEYPSHSLIELDLYDTNGTSSLLYDLFHADADAYHAGRDANGTGTGESETDHQGGGAGTTAAATTLTPKRPQCVWGQSNKSTDKKKRQIEKQKKLKKQQRTS